MVLRGVNKGSAYISIQASQQGRILAVYARIIRNMQNKR